jgi:UDPglucose 6-dehydrogenase
MSGSDLGERIEDAEIYVICTQETVVEGIVQRLIWKEGLAGSLIVVRSTTPIGTIKRLQETHYSHICHWPEHLREVTSMWDAYFPTFISFGECCKEHGDILHSIVEPIGVPTIRSDVTTSEASKYAINNFKAVLVSYWNEFFNLSKKMGFNGHLAARIAANDRVIPHYGTVLGGAYGGKCLPKDIKATIQIYKDEDMKATLLEAVDQVNEEVKKAHGESSIRTG